MIYRRCRLIPAKQPATPYLFLSLDGQILDIAVESFEVQMSISSILQGSMVIVDKTFNEFDKLINRIRNAYDTAIYVVFQWVYPDGSASQASPFLKLFLHTFRPTFKEYYEVSVEFKGYYYTKSLKVKEKNYRGRYSECLREMCEDMGYRLQIEPQIENDEETVIECRGRSPVHIISDLITKGEIKPQGGGVYYYHVDDVQGAVNIKKVQEGQSKRTYVVRGGKDVIDFSIEKDLAILTSFGGEQVTEYRADLESKRVRKRKIGEARGLALSEEETNRVIRTYSNTGTADRQNELYRFLGNRASLTVVGEPDIVPGDTIKVLAPKPDGSLHWASGDYFVSGVSHSLRSGSFITTMELGRYEE